MRVGIAGKGGVGKSMIAANLARIMARRGHLVVAVDCDSDPNLALSAGVPPRVAERMRPFLDQSGGKMTFPRGVPAPELIRDYGFAGPDNVTLLLAAQVEHAGAG
jgi:CO dehydrogenase maturation factor